jgi:ABC-2 type transport system ATP-binding protein
MRGATPGSSSSRSATGGVTVLLVTHFMEEAERLCDRMALLDAGRLVAMDTPAGLVARVSAGQRIRFRPSQPLPADLRLEQASLDDAFVALADHALD